MNKAIPIHKSSLKVMFMLTIFALIAGLLIYIAKKTTNIIIREKIKILLVVIVLSPFEGIENFASIKSHLSLTDSY